MNKIIFFILTGIMLFSCKTNTTQSVEEEEELQQISVDPFFKLSLAQWSLNREISEGFMSPIDFAKQAADMGFEGVEYVSSLYEPLLMGEDDTKMSLDELIDTLKHESNKYGVENLLIMVDGEGDLSVIEEAERNTAVENHKKWVDAAAELGCHSIRVNLFGAQEAEEWKEASIDGLTKLSTYAASKNVNVLVENHGGLSSNAALLMEVMDGVNMENCGTLPDFGNFCLRREGGARWSAPCIEEYDMYKGVKELMPKAMAVSAKSYEFDEDGSETKIDYKKMLQIVKDAGYTGFIGVEFEGEASSTEGIEDTKNLLLKAAAALQN